MIILEVLFIGHFGHSWPQEKAAKPIGLVLAVWSLGHLAGITSTSKMFPPLVVQVDKVAKRMYGFIFKSTDMSKKSKDRLRDPAL